MSSPHAVYITERITKKVKQCLKPCTGQWTEVVENAASPRVGEAVLFPGREYLSSQCYHTKICALEQELKQMEVDATHSYIVTTAGELFVRRLHLSNKADNWEDNLDASLNFTKITPILQLRNDANSIAESVVFFKLQVVSIALATHSEHIHVLVNAIDERNHTVGISLECLKPCYDSDYLVNHFPKKDSLYQFGAISMDDKQLYGIAAVTGALFTKAVTVNVPELVRRQNNHIDNEHDERLLNFRALDPNSQGLVTKAGDQPPEMRSQIMASLEQLSSNVGRPQWFSVPPDQPSASGVELLQFWNTLPQDGFFTVSASSNDLKTSEITSSYSVHGESRHCDLNHYKHKMVHYHVSDTRIRQYYKRYCESLASDCRWNPDSLVCERLVATEDSRLQNPSILYGDESCRSVDVIDTTDGIMRKAAGFAVEEIDNGEQKHRVIYEEPECVDHMVRVQLGDERPDCWDYNETIDGTSGCFHHNLQYLEENTRQGVVENYNDPTVIGNLTHWKHDYCFNIGYSSTAFIVQCAGEFQESDDCGTFVEVHKAGDSRIISRQRLPLDSPFTNGFRYASAFCYQLHGFMI